MIFSPDSVRLTFAEAGRGVWRSGGTKDAWIHRKAVPYMIIAQPTEGRYKIGCGGGTAELIPAGEAFLTAPNVSLTIEHLCNPRTGRMKYRYVHFNFIIFDAINLASLFELPLRVDGKWAGRFGRIADKMYAVQNSSGAQSMNSIALLNEMAFSLLRLLLEYLESIKIVPNMDPAIMRLIPVLEYARRHLDRKFEVANLARRANLSVPRFHSEFKRLFGDSPLEHLRKMRLSKASDLLRSSSSPSIHQSGIRRDPATRCI